MTKPRNKTLDLNETTKHRITLPLGKESTRIINAIAGRFRKETGMEWSQADVLASAAGLGLRSMASKHGIEHQPLLALID